MDIVYMIMSIVIFVLVVIMSIITFTNTPTSVQFAKVQEWLLYACFEAEKLFGSKTGQIKLRYVYDKFVEKFYWIAKFISFEKFSSLVDITLDKLRELINSNNNIANLIEDNKDEEKED